MTKTLITPPYGTIINVISVAAVQEAHLLLEGNKTFGRKVVRTVA